MTTGGIWAKVHKWLALLIATALALAMSIAGIVLLPSRLGYRAWRRRRRAPINARRTPSAVPPG